MMAVESYAAQKPNIVLSYIDDWAWNGSPVAMDDAMANSRMPVLQMPNVERLAQEGMRFRNAYGSPQCSPARACIQTGQSNPRNGLTVHLNSKELYYDTQKEYRSFPLVANIADRELDDDAHSIAEALKPLRYVSAHVGKWHMRGDPGKEGYIVHDGDTDSYFHYPHYRSSVPHSAIISGSSKVIHFYDRPDIPMLFDLSGDMGEVSNIAQQHPEKHQRLYKQMMRYLVQVGARFPKPNPNYDPEAYKADRKTQERIQWGPFAGQRALEEDEMATQATGL